MSFLPRYVNPRTNIAWKILLSVQHQTWQHSNFLAIQPHSVSSISGHAVGLQCQQFFTISIVIACMLYCFVDLQVFGAQQAQRGQYMKTR